MNAADAMNAAIHALNQIDKLVDGGNPDDAESACEEIADITGNVIGELARAGFTDTP